MVTQTELKWRDLISDFQNSNLSPKDFCKQAKVNVACFYKWKKHYETVGLEEPGFVEVNSQIFKEKPKLAPAGLNQVIRIITSNGTTLEIPL